VSKASDAELLRRHQAGAPDAFETLTRRYAAELYGFVFRFVGNHAATEDLVQETFLQVHLSADTFDADRQFKPWLYTIAANKARDFLRSRGRRMGLSLDVPTEADRPSAGELLESHEPAVTAELETEQQRARVQAVVATMPEHLRMILVLGYFQQLSYAEIAEVLNIPVGTVKSRLHAAVNHFAGLWEQEQRRVAPNPKQEVEP
jgi:RNA polymerase sigma-70 factor (ECF subfamily)